MKLDLTPRAIGSYVRTARTVTFRVISLMNETGYHRDGINRGSGPILVVGEAIVIFHVMINYSNDEFLKDLSEYLKRLQKRRSSH